MFEGKVKIILSTIYDDVIHGYTDDKINRVIVFDLPGISRHFIDDVEDAIPMVSVYADTVRDDALEIQASWYYGVNDEIVIYDYRFGKKYGTDSHLGCDYYTDPNDRWVADYDVRDIDDPHYYGHVE